MRYDLTMITKILRNCFRSTVLEKLLKLFETVVYVEKEHNEEQWQSETATYLMFERYLDNCEGNPK